MKLTTRFLLGLLSVGAVTAAQASITSSLFWSTDTSKINDSNGWSYGPNKGSAVLTGIQYAAGQVAGSVQTDTVLDPTLLRGNYMNNDTGQSWGGYSDVLTMQVPFTIGSVNISAPGDWSYTVIVPTLVGGQYQGSIQFSGGTAIGAGGELDFSYTLTFGGSMQYNINEQLTPTIVPEPGTMSLLLLGGLAVAGFAQCRRSAAARPPV